MMNEGLAVLIIVLIAITVLLAVFNKQIIAALQPVGRKLRE